MKSTVANKDVKREDKNRALQIIELLEKEHGDAKIALRYASPLELLVATMLSAQCTDTRVNIVSKELFKKYKNAEDFANADVKELEEDIRSTGFFRNKAKNIIRSCQILLEKFHGQVPRTMHEMVELPGVARKTANIVLANAFGIIEGIAVDTHVRRLATRLKLTEHNNPNQIEKDLMKVVPQTHWKRITDLLIHHGRRVCVARKPKCQICILRNICPSAFTFDSSLKFV
jgi:endonuclease-3